MTTLETLKAARKLVTPKDRWTKDANARGKSGKEVLVNSRYAICYCANGAIWKSSKERFWDALQALEDVTKCDIATFNDTHTHGEVLRAFDEAIKKLEAA